ncbi:MAG: bifunctional phosphoribosyl-AMP cyclohydrolase/phosphoribosyl-ATP diphosphatase HisIE [Woeseia sp.]
MTSLHEKIDWQKGGGLVPAIVQHALSARVLMLGYMNAEALAATLSSESVTFYSRSRNCLWTKGETSGNRLELHNIELDCDGDALLVTAAPTGPACHLEKLSCFDRDAELPGFGFVGQLEFIIRDRMEHRPSESYTARLFAEGDRRIAQKMGEEAIELVLAATTASRNEQLEEAADLVYHLLVLLASKGISLADVSSKLKARHES